MSLEFPFAWRWLGLPGGDLCVICGVCPQTQGVTVFGGRRCRSCGAGDVGWRRTLFYSVRMPTRAMYSTPPPPSLRLSPRLQPQNDASCFSMACSCSPSYPSCCFRLHSVCSQEETSCYGKGSFHFWIISGYHVAQISQKLSSQYSLMLVLDTWYFNVDTWYLFYVDTWQHVRALLRPTYLWRSPHGRKI